MCAEKASFSSCMGCVKSLVNFEKNTPEFMPAITRPTLMLDEQRVIENIRQVKSKADAHKVLFRPHFKTHQSGVVGQWFRQEGVEAITVSSVDMAFYFAAHGWYDITIAFPLNVNQMEMINLLASRIRLTVIIDNDQQALALVSSMQNPINVMIELDTGHRRTGIDAADTSSIARLADKLDRAPDITLTGLLTHAGHTYKAVGYQAIEAIALVAYEKMSAARERLGYPGLLLSWGDTPSCSMLEMLPPFDEWRPGNFVFFDVMQYHIGSCRIDQIAVALYCPVVSVYPERHQMVVHAGAVHLSKDFIDAEDGFSLYGYLVRPETDGWSDPLPGAWLCSISQEHGVIQFISGSPMLFRPGDMVGILPVHSCLAADTMGGYCTLSGNLVPMFRKSFV